SHLLDGHAAFEVDASLEVACRDLLRRGDGRDEGVVLVAPERTVDVVVAALVVARRLPRHLHVDRLGGHRGGDRVVEVQGRGAAPRAGGARGGGRGGRW